MKRPLRVLLSARDPGAAGNIIALYKQLRGDRDVHLFAVASGVASRRLSASGITHERFWVAGGVDYVQKGEDHSILLNNARKILQKSEPDIVIASVSSVGAGVDEALIAVSNVPVIAIQDFWADVNPLLGKTADLYIVLDAYAAQLSQARFGVSAIPMGLPKYKLYETLDFPEMKRDTRKNIGMPSRKKLIGWFGQSPEIPGHESVFASFLKACAMTRSDVVLFLREHPKFDQRKRQHVQMAQRERLDLIQFDRSFKTEELIAACDLVVTPFSLCGFDHAVMSAYSKEPLGATLYLMTNKRIRDFADQVCGMVTFPIVHHEGVGACLKANDISTISDAMETMMSTEAIADYHRKCHGIIKQFNYRQFKTLIQSFAQQEKKSPYKFSIYDD